MQTICIDATWEKDIQLPQSLLESITTKNYKTIALFASVQFLRVDTVIKQLESIGVQVKTTKAKRTNVPMQILGCDAYHDSFENHIIDECDALMYIGDGLFHPKALLLTQQYKKNIKPVILWNAVNEIVYEIGKKDIEQQVQRMKANLVRYLAAKTIGILVTVKPGQQYLGAALKLKAKIISEGKEAFVFIDDTINLNLLENYPFIDAWVNTACPRIGTDDLVNTHKPIINVKEAFDPVAALQRFEE